MKTSYLSIFLVLYVTNAAVVHNTTTEVRTGGQIRVHYDDELQACNDVVFLALGTSMNVGDYDKLASLIVEMMKSTAVVIADPDPDWMVKTNPHYYAELANHVFQNLEDFLPGECNQQSQVGIAVGGHSAGGSAAFKAVTEGLFDFDPTSYIGLDPFPIREVMVDMLHIPSLSWGFTATTCGVNVDEAAKAAYESSNNYARVLYLAENEEDSAGLSHCSFTDHGCMGPVCPCHENSNSLRASLARAVSVFLDEVRSGSINKEEFEGVVDDTTKLKVGLCVGSDDATNGCTPLYKDTEVEA